MTKSIRDYLPSKDVVMVSGRVNKELVDQVKAIMERDNLSMVEILKACFMKLVDEDTVKKGKKHA